MDSTISLRCTVEMNKIILVRYIRAVLSSYNIKGVCRGGGDEKKCFVRKGYKGGFLGYKLGFLGDPKKLDNPASCRYIVVILKSAPPPL